MFLDWGACHAIPFTVAVWNFVYERMLLQEAINSASSITQTLSGELVDGQRQLLAKLIKNWKKSKFI